MQTKNIKKLKELGFIEESAYFYKKVGKTTDRFMTTIIFDKEEKIKKLEEDIEKFETEVDYVLSTSNTVTLIEVSE